MLAGSTAIAEMRSGKEGARSRGFGAYAEQPAIKSAEVTHAYLCAVFETLEKHRETGIIDRQRLISQNGARADARIIANGPDPVLTPLGKRKKPVPRTTRVRSLRSNTSDRINGRP
jgi:hypothetical protein